MTTRIQLKQLAYARSGDKGNISDIGVMAFSHDVYQLLKEKLTVAALKDFFGKAVTGQIKVYDIPNLDSLEIVMYGALGGGASKSLRWDATGKSMCGALLRMELELDEETAERILSSIPANIIGNHS